MHVVLSERGLYFLRACVVVCVEGWQRHFISLGITGYLNWSLIFNSKIDPLKTQTTKMSAYIYLEYKHRCQALRRASIPWASLEVSISRHFKIY